MMEDSVISLNDVGLNNYKTDGLPQRSLVDSLYSNLGENVTVGDRNNVLPGGGINPFTGDAGNQLQQLIFNRLKLIFGDNFANSPNNPFLNGGFSNNIPFTGASSLPFNINNAPVGNGNTNLGNNNATIGNFNSNFASDNATIGNGNWNFNSNNATIGNGNWNFANSNTTIGNGNWYWDYGSNNATLGNGNWHFGSDNRSIGNGNWDFGSNNTIIGNGNWIFTSGNTVVGNGNWLVDSSNTSIGISTNSSNSEFALQATRTSIDTLINSLIGTIGQDFIGLTGKFDVSESQTFNRLILSRNNGSNSGNISIDIEQLVTLLSGFSTNEIPNQPTQNSQSVPEPTSLISVIVFGFVGLLWLKFKKRNVTIKNNLFGS